MGLFNNKNKLQTVPPIIAHNGEMVRFEQENAINYESVLEWLCGLSDEDYAKTCEVASIYRKANAEAAQALEVEQEVTTFITHPEPELENPDDEDQDIKTILDDDDELNSAFLDHEPIKKPKASKKK